ncbi:MAG: hypothetical protein SFV81_14045 [Pirellulaceae bacterium]|nr:hypothetical protein [Pirellulaceae bacterium]
MSSKCWNWKKWSLSGAIVLALFSGCKDSEYAHHNTEVPIAQFYGPQGQPNTATVRWQKVDTALIQSVCSHSSLRELNICVATRDGSPIFPSVSKLPNLEALTVIEVPLTDDELSSLSEAGKLTSLELSRTGITGAGLKHLAKLPLKRLVIRDKHLSLEGLQAIASLTELEELELCVPSIHLADIPAMASKSNLKSVIISDGHFSYREFGGLKFLAGASRLTNLHLSGPNLNDRSLKAIGTLSGLQNLTIGKSVISEEGIEYLSTLEHLQSVDIPSLHSLQDAIRLAESNDEPLPQPRRS